MLMQDAAVKSWAGLGAGLGAGAGTEKPRQRHPACSRGMNACVLDQASDRADGWVMRKFDAWTAFLLMLFVIVGICGLFTSFASSLPWERGMARSLLLDSVLAAENAPDAAEKIAALRPQLGALAPDVLDAPGPLAERVAAARRTVVDEQRRESASINFRVRLMLGIVTLLAGGMGAGIMAMAKKGAYQAGLEYEVPETALLPENN